MVTTLKKKILRREERNQKASLTQVRCDRAWDLKNMVKCRRIYTYFKGNVSWIYWLNVNRGKYEKEEPIMMPMILAEYRQ